MTNNSEGHQKTKHLKMSPNKFEVILERRVMRRMKNKNVRVGKGSDVVHEKMVFSTK